MAECFSMKAIIDLTDPLTVAISIDLHVLSRCLCVCVSVCVIWVILLMIPACFLLKLLAAPVGPQHSRFSHLYRFTDS